MSDESPTPGPRKIGGEVLELRVPDSLAERWDVLVLHATDATAPRAKAAALGLSWPRFRRKHRYQGDANKYGGEVQDVLLRAGASYSEIMLAGTEALNLCAEGLPGVEGAPDFSEPPADSGGSRSGG